jgi:hypothetical protein
LERCPVLEMYKDFVTCIGTYKGSSIYIDGKEFIGIFAGYGIYIIY